MARYSYPSTEDAVMQAETLLDLLALDDDMDGPTPTPIVQGAPDGMFQHLEYALTNAKLDVTNAAKSMLQMGEACRMFPMYVDGHSVHRAAATLEYAIENHAEARNDLYRFFHQHAHGEHQ